MRKIQTKEEQEKKGRRNKILTGIILVAIMVFGTVGYAFFGRGIGLEGKTEKVVYNSQEFKLLESGLWQAEIQGHTFFFNYLPNETEEIAVPLILSMGNYVGRPLYFNSENPAATIEIKQNLASLASKMPQEACVKNLNEECTEDWPIKNCSDNIIIIREKQINEISQEDNCIFIQGNYSDLVKISDAFLYKILGIRSF